LADHRGTVRRICKITLSQADYGLNIIPYVKQGKYFYGGKFLPEIQSKIIIKCDEERASPDDPPHLSIHESGQVQVRVGTELAGPIRMTPLKDL
jgi:hypothetical protein